MENAESSSRYPTGHGVGHPREVSRGRGRGRPRRTSLPDPSPRASPYVAADNCRTRMARNRNRGLLGTYVLSNKFSSAQYILNFVPSSTSWHQSSNNINQDGFNQCARSLDDIIQL